ncbi:ABC transporter ATP-binding protein [Dysgonomonas sp. BGC7]|uniref:ABC transporter ATP-binding protein n=1 Tax=Dysgonomonas sp. BGC7 TaxID=1658008 RepID=UPI0006818A8A|nr:ABC transporter ATP-binding protein [Dysgonomonas sp. BGC7]MBD8390463.1 ABC transporter ATP-binding protein [Dysgonomonas sp. BGC7]
MKSTTDLRVENIHVKLGDSLIIDGIDLNVCNNSFTAILGPNGSGKSTLLKSIYRVLKPCMGYIYLNDREIPEMTGKEVAKKMSVVSQFQSNSFDYTVEETVFTGRTPHLKALEKESSEDKKIVKDALIKTGLLEYKDRSIATLSGGEKQRVALARAIAQNPSIMILDEPSNHLDIKYQIEILSIIKKLNINILAALHDVSLAAMFCDYIFFIKGGKIRYQGIPKDIITKEILKDIYGVDCEIFVHPDTNNICVSYYK